MAEERKGVTDAELELEVDITQERFKVAFEAYKTREALRKQRDTRSDAFKRADKTWTEYRERYKNAGGDAERGRRDEALARVLEQQSYDDGVRQLAKARDPDFCNAYDAFCRLLDLGKEVAHADSAATRKAREGAREVFAKFTHAYAEEVRPEYVQRRDAVGRVMTTMVHEDTNRETLLQDMGNHLDLVAATKNTNDCGMLFMLFGATLFLAGVCMFVYMNKLEPWPLTG